MAKAGGLGILHRNMSVDEQVESLKWVRRKIHSGGMIDKPITFSPQQRIADLQHRVATAGFSFSSFPIVDDAGRFVGLITRDELDFAEGKNLELGAVMKKVGEMIGGGGSGNLAKFRNSLCSSPVQNREKM
jgi:IMP dehydrogenase